MAWGRKECGMRARIALRPSSLMAISGSPNVSFKPDFEVCECVREKLFSNMHPRLILPIKVVYVWWWMTEIWWNFAEACNSPPLCEWKESLKFCGWQHSIATISFVISTSSEKVHLTSLWLELKLYVLFNVHTYNYRLTNQTKHPTPDSYVL